jgi:hypothetical protein
MVLTLSLLFIVLVIVRITHVYLFMKKITKLCNKYDWKHIDVNPDLLVDVLEDEKYHLNKEWSAYYFLFLKGPNPLSFLYVETFNNRRTIQQGSC